MSTPRICHLRLMREGMAEGRYDAQPRTFVGGIKIICPFEMHPPTLKGLRER
jgi:hypothetical protein